MKNKFFSRLLRGAKIHSLLFALAVIAVCVVILSFIWINRNTHVTITTSEQPTLSPTLMESIEQIGEWEFLAIHDEELVDTTHSSFFGDKRLIRIYSGTLRLGINLKEAKEGWIHEHNDSVSVILPPIKLLDEDFIDEAQTKSVLEKGEWDNAAHQAMYNKAYRMMKQRCLTKKNMQTARENAVVQITELLRGMGFKNIRVKK